MSRSKRSADEQQDQAVAMAVNPEDSSSSDDNDLKTPSKKVRLNLATDGSSPVEETKAAVYIDENQRPVTHDHYIITPGSKRQPDVKSEESPAVALSVEPAKGSVPPGTTSEGVRRSLFTQDLSSKAQLVTPSRSALATVQSPSKRRLIFGRPSTEIAVQDNVKRAYTLVRRLTGSIGGNASHGPIYGELTMGSMQKVVNLMKEHTDFDHSCRFLDVGSGIGKPNFHVAYDPGVELSYGVEVDAERWLLSMNCHRGILGLDDEVVYDDGIANTGEKSDANVDDYSKRGGTEERGNLTEDPTKSTDTGESTVECSSHAGCRCIFMHGDIRGAKVFDPFTHVYMFSIGFPPALWLNLVDIWNRSKSPYLICFHGPKDIIHSYEFDVELLAQTPTSMHGSREGHTGYLYRRIGANKPIIIRSNEAIIDPFFVEGVELVRSGSKSLKAWVESTLNKKMAPGATTRARRQILNKSA